MEAQVFGKERGAGRRRLRILGISGSARKGSYNTALLEAAVELMPPGSVLEPFDVSVLPLFNQDLEADLPQAIREFKQRIRDCDAVLFSTPEHNYSVSALLKNAIEWGNRPEIDNSWDGKPAAIISASTSPRGGVRAQLHLRQIMVDLNMHPINQPQVLVARAQEKFDSNSRLTDEKIREALRTLLATLVDWTVKLQAGAAGA